MTRRSQRLPKDAQGKVPVPHDATTIVEESVVWLHALQSYGKDELTANELKFVAVATKNLAIIHKRLTRAHRS